MPPSFHIRQIVRLLFIVGLALASHNACLAPQPVPKPIQTQPASPEVPYGEGLLWEVQGPEGTPPSFVFGTIHVSDPRVVNLPSVVDESLAASRVFLPEISLDYMNLARLSAEMFFPLGAGTTLEDILGADLFERTATALANYGIPYESARRMRPWAVIMILSSTPAQQGQQQVSGDSAQPVLDMVLYQRARALGLDVVELESIEEQVGIFDGLIEADQIELIVRAIDSRSATAQLSIEDLIRYYQKRNLTPVLESIERENAASPLMARVNERMLDRRNRQMVQRMDLHLRQGGVFVAVGFLHLPGTQGILHLLEVQGYALKRLY